jgi:hypothetical protein
MSTQRQTHRIAGWLASAAAALATAAFPVAAAYAQDAADEARAPLSSDQLDDLVGRIALYPDDLIGIVLPASTYPLQVVQAQRFLEQRAKNPKLKPDERWNDSVVALLNYPQIVKLMNDDLDWTSDLGEAVANQRADVLDAIQGFRDRAYAAGNLKTDDRQVVKREDDEISIAPANPEVIYVPYYEPESVVVAQTRPVYYYYPIAYPVYYYPYPIDYRFQTGFFWGVTTAFTIGWHSHDVNVWRYGHFGHPYYGRTYYDPFYVRNNTRINVNIVSRGGRAVWEPRYRHPSRPIVIGSDHRAPSTRAPSAAPRGPSAAPQRNVRESSRGGIYRSGTATDTRRDPRSTVGNSPPPAGANAANAAERARRAGQRAVPQAAPAAPDGQAAPPASGRRYIQPRVTDRTAPQIRGTERGLGRSPAQTAPRVESRQLTAPPRAAPRAVPAPRAEAPHGGDRGARASGRSAGGASHREVQRGGADRR